MVRIFKKLKSSTFIQSFFHFYKKSEIDISSVAVAYYLFLALFPILLLVANILPYLNLKVSDFLGYLGEYLPDKLYNLISDFLNNILTQQSQYLLFISIASAIWTFSKTISFLQRAYNKAYGITNQRKIVLSRLLGVIVSILIFILLLFAVLSSIFGQKVIHLVYHYFSFNKDIYTLFLGLVQPFTTAVLFLTIFILYYLLPSVHIPRFKYILPGTFLVTLVLVIITNLGNLVFDHLVARYTSFNTVTTAFILSIMFFFICMARLLIIGAVINASYQSHCESIVQFKRETFWQRFMEKLKNNMM